MKTAKEMFENIEMFGVKGHYSFDNDGDPTIEWSYSIYSCNDYFDLKSKDFEKFYCYKRYVCSLYRYP